MSQTSLSGLKPGRPRLMTQEKIDKRIRSGDGRGVTESYVPWIKIWSFASRGASHMVPGVKVHRTHHLLSTIEYHYLLLLEYDKSVIDIREQFPLLPQVETQAIASSLNIRHPVYIGTKVPFVMTTDFLITVVDDNGKERLVARTLKYRSELQSASKDERNRIIQKLDIESRYWAARSIEWSLVFYENLSQNKIKNLQLLRGYAVVPSSLATEKNITRLIDYISCAQTGKIPVRALLERASKALFIEYVCIKKLYFHLIWSDKLSVDLCNEVIELSKPLYLKINKNSSAQLEESRHA